MIFRIFVEIHGYSWIFIEIHGNPWKSMDTQEYPGIFINFQKILDIIGYLEILIFQISMEIHVCLSYHTWISNMVLLEKLVMISIFHKCLSTKIHPVRRSSLPVVITISHTFRQSTNYCCTKKNYSYYYSRSSMQHTLHTKLLNNQLQRLICISWLQLSNHLDDSPFSQKKV